MKYPTIFNSADVAIITKIDLAAAVDFNSPSARANIQAVRPAMGVFELSSKSGAGMQDYFDFLAANLVQMRGPALFRPTV